MGHISTGDNLVSMKIMDKNWFLRSQYQDGDKQIGLLNYKIINQKKEEFLPKNLRRNDNIMLFSIELAPKGVKNWLAVLSHMNFLKNRTKFIYEF